MSNKRVNYKIDGYMTNSLLENFVAVTAVLLVPLSTTKAAGHDGWIAPIIATLSAAYLIFVVYWLGKLYPGKTAIEYLPLLLGNVAGKITGLVYILLLAWICATAIRVFIALIFGTGVFTITPEIVVGLMLIIATTYATASGLEVIGRTMSIFWLLIMIIYLVFMLEIIPLMKVSALLPVGEAGVPAILKSSLVSHGFRAEVIILAMLLPYIRSPREALIGAHLANLLIGFVMMLTIIATISIMGAGMTARSFFAPFSIADFMPTFGVKSFLVFVWIIGFWGKVALAQYVITDGLAKWIGLRERGPIILPVAFLLLVFSLIFYENSTDLFETITNILPGIGLFFGYLIPTLLLIIGLIKKK